MSALSPRAPLTRITGDSAPARSNAIVVPSFDKMLFTDRSPIVCSEQLVGLAPMALTGATARSRRPSGHLRPRRAASAGQRECGSRALSCAASSAIQIQPTVTAPPKTQHGRRVTSTGSHSGEPSKEDHAGSPGVDGPAALAEDSSAAGDHETGRYQGKETDAGAGEVQGAVPGDAGGWPGRPRSPGGASSGWQSPSHPDRARDGQQACEDEASDLDPAQGSVAQQARDVAGDVEARSRERLDESPEHEQRPGGDAAGQKRACPRRWRHG